MRKLKCAVGFLLWALVAGTVMAEEPYRLLIEPKFMRNEVAWPIEGSETTVLVPARLEGGEVKPLRRNDFLGDGAARRNVILAEAQAAASVVLKDLKITYVRDAKKVIEYATIESENPLTASAVLAPDFAEKFRNTLGPDFLVAIPSRNLIFIFPRLSSISGQMSESVIMAYQTADNPVSREVFELRGGKLIAIGAYR